MKQEKPEVLKELDRAWDKAHIILKAIIYFASNQGKKRLPTIEEFVLSEVVTAAGKYLSGEENFSGYFRRLENGKHCLDNDGWQIKTCQYVEELFSRFGGKFPEDFSKAFKKLVSLGHQSSHGEGWWNCWLFTFYKSSMICNSPFVSTFSLSVEFVNKVESEVLPQLSTEELLHIEEIAGLMKKYIQEDIEFIKKQYSW